MDKKTFDAFNQLWVLYKSCTEQADYKNPEFWDKLVAETGRIVEAADGADDPEFVSDFAMIVISSVERIAKRESGE